MADASWVALATVVVAITQHTNEPTTTNTLLVVDNGAPRGVALALLAFTPPRPAAYHALLVLRGSSKRSVDDAGVTLGI